MKRNFYPRSPCGERPHRAAYWMHCRYFYPRSPCGERHCAGSITATPPRFLSTLSLRRATKVNAPKRAADARFLSTLSLRRATSNSLLTSVVSSADFYPRSPCGERHYVCQSSRCGWLISIHALLAESDSPLSHAISFSAYFYPRSPCGERQADSVSKWTAT